LGASGKFHSAELVSKLSLEGFDKRRREYKHLGWVYVAQNSSFADKVLTSAVTFSTEALEIDFREN